MRTQGVRIFFVIFIAYLSDYRVESGFEVGQVITKEMFQRLDLYRICNGRAAQIKLFHDDVPTTCQNAVPGSSWGYCKSVTVNLIDPKMTTTFENVPLGICVVSARAVKCVGLVDRIGVGERPFVFNYDASRNTCSALTSALP